MQFKHTIKLILVAGFIAPMPLSAGLPTWGMMKVPAFLHDLSLDQFK